MWSKSFRESLKRQLIQNVCGQSELDERPKRIATLISLLPDGLSRRLVT